MSRLFAILLVVAVLAAAPVLRAEVVAGLYAASVPVADQSDAALDRAARQALTEVLVKVSGSSLALEHPAVRAALEDARAQVQQYAFRQDEYSAGGLSAWVEFDGAWVTGLLTRAGLPVWTANRPPVLVWLAVESAGQRHLVGAAETPELAVQLLRAFQRRGVPARLPLYDLDDATAVTPEDVWEQQGDALRAASARYGVEDILVGRAVEVSSGQWVGDWSYLYGAQRRDRSSDAPSARDFVASGANLVAEAMASRYAVAPSGAGEGAVHLAVSGVRDFADYAAIVNWLESLELVEYANVARIDGDRVEFDLVATLDAPRLVKLLELNQHLQPVDPARQDLEYQWRK